MPDKKFSQLDEVTDVQAADDFALERAGVSKRITGANLESEIGGGFDGSEQFGFYSGNDVSVPDGFSAQQLTWDSLGSGVAVLDLTDPIYPTVVAGGIYAVSVVVQTMDVLTAGAGFSAVLHLDFLGQDWVNEASVSDPATVGGYTLVSLSTTGYIPADGVIAVTVALDDGVAARNFNLREASVQKVSGTGGGSLPAWWTIDSTPGSEKLSYHFDGDAFPRWTLASGVDGLHGGDGTFDPYAEGALRFFVDGDGGDTGGVRWRFYANGARLELGTYSGERGPTIDSPGAFTLGQQKLALRAGSNDPNSVLFGGPFGGNVGDIYFNVDGGALTTIWRCTVAGDVGDATWVGIL